MFSDAQHRIDAASAADLQIATGVASPLLLDFGQI
jgi:hypothetical protein